LAAKKPNQAPALASSSSAGSLRLAGGVNRGIQALQRLGQQGAVNRLLALEVGIDGAGGVAGLFGDFADAGALDAQALEHHTGGVQHPLAARVGLGLLTV
jgi:hypothetical protein